MDDGGRGGADGSVEGVLGADETSVGTRLDRTRMGGFLGGPSVRSIAVAGRAGGVPGVGGATCDLRIEDPGEAV